MSRTLSNTEIGTALECPVPGSAPIARARAMRAEGLTFRAISVALDMDVMTVHYWCRPEFTPTYTPRGTPFWDRVDVGGPEDCWEWLSGRHPQGHGQCTIDGRKVYAHRHAFELTNGPIPVGLVIRHRCDNPPCCNPAHLLSGTVADNARDAVERGRVARQPRGEASSLAKYSDELIVEVRRLRGDGLTYREIAERTGIEQSYVCRLCNGARS